MPPDRLRPARAAWEAQTQLLSAWLRGRAAGVPACAAKVTREAAGRLADLLAGLTQVPAELASALDGPRPAGRVRGMTPAAYLAARPPAAAAAGFAAAASSAATGSTAASSAETSSAAFEAAVARVAEGLDAAGEADPVLAAAHGPVRASDLLAVSVVQLVQLVLLAGDAAGELPERPPGHPAPAAVRLAVRTLAAVLAERHPGHSVEVRVPPHAAVQIGAGPAHTRGTPPNVVETAPLVFLAMAAGGRSFADAVAAGEVRASGARADLTGYLPLLT